MRSSSLARRFAVACVVTWLSRVRCEVDLDELHADGLAAFRALELSEAGVHFRSLQTAIEAIPELDARHVRMHAEALKMLGMASASLSDLDEAIHLWRSAITSRQRVPDEGARAFEREIGGVVGYAHKYCAKVALSDPESAQAQSNAGITAVAVGQKADAMRYFERSLKLRPGHAPTLGALGELYANLERFDEAYGLLGEYAALAADSNQTGDRHAQICLHLAVAACNSAGLNSQPCEEAWLAAFEASVAAGNQPVASLAIASAIKTHLERFGDTALEGARALGRRGVEAGALNDPLQAPKHLVRGISAHAYRDDAWSWPIVQALESNFPAIEKEVLAAYDSGGLHSHATFDSVTSLVTKGYWGEIDIIATGTVKRSTIELLPFTSKLVLSFPEAATMVRGGSKVSVIEPDSLVKPHTGTSNARLRIHLGVRIPKQGVGIKVAGETRVWETGKCLVLDDSFVHSVWQNSTEPRIVLIVDVWHPELDRAARLDALKTEPHLLNLYKANLVEFGDPPDPPASKEKKKKRKAGKRPQRASRENAAADKEGEAARREEL